MHCSWLSISFILLLYFSFNGVSGAGHREQHHSAPVVVGTVVYCDTCFRQEVSKSTHIISGATVAVECGGDGMKSFREEVKTNEKGEFEAKLPVSIGKHVNKINRCSVKLVSNREPNCAVATTATATSSEIRFKSKRASGTHVLSAGIFMFKPKSCNQKDFIGKDGFLLPPNPFQPPKAPSPLIPPLPFQPPPPTVIPPPPPPPSLIPPIPGIPMPSGFNLPHLRKTTP